MNHFSFFLAPVSNVVPHKTVELHQIYNVIRGDYYRQPTEELQRLRRLQQEEKSLRGMCNDSRPAISTMPLSVENSPAGAMMPCWPIAD